MPRYMQSQPSWHFVEQGLEPRSHGSLIMTILNRQASNKQILLISRYYFFSYSAIS